MSQFYNPILSSGNNCNFLTTFGSVVTYIAVEMSPASGGKGQKASKVSEWAINVVELFTILSYPACVEFETNDDQVTFTIKVPDPIVGTLIEQGSMGQLTPTETGQSYTGTYSTTVFPTTNAFWAYLQRIALFISNSVTVLDHNQTKQDLDGQTAYMMATPGLLMYILYNKSNGALSFSEAWVLNQSQAANVLSDMSSNLTVASGSFSLAPLFTNWTYSSSLFSSDNEFARYLFNMLVTAAGGGAPLVTPGSGSPAYLIATQLTPSSGGFAMNNLLYLEANFTNDSWKTAAYTPIPQTSLEKVTVEVSNDTFTIKSSAGSALLSDIPYDKTLLGQGTTVSDVVNTFVGTITGTSTTFDTISVITNESSNAVTITQTQKLDNTVTVESGQTVVSAQFPGFATMVASDADDPSTGTYYAHLSVPPTSLVSPMVPNMGPILTLVNQFTITTGDVNAMNEAIEFYKNTWNTSSGSTAKADKSVWKTFNSNIRSFNGAKASNPDGNASFLEALAAGLFNDNLLLGTNSYGFDSVQLGLAAQWYLTPKNLDNSYTVYKNPPNQKESPFSSKNKIGTLQVTSPSGSSNVVSNLELNFLGEELNLSTSSIIPTGLNSDQKPELIILNYFKVAVGDSHTDNFIGSYITYPPSKGNGGSSSSSNTVAVVGTTNLPSSSATWIWGVVGGLVGLGVVTWFFESEAGAAEVEAEVLSDPDVGTPEWYVLEERLAQARRAANVAGDNLAQNVSNAARAETASEIRDEAAQVEEMDTEIIEEENGEGGNLPNEIKHDADDANEKIDDVIGDADELSAVDSLPQLESEVGALVSDVSALNVAVDTLKDELTSKKESETIAEEEDAIDSDESALAGAGDDGFIPDIGDSPLDSVPEEIPI